MLKGEGPLLPRSMTHGTFEECDSLTPPQPPHTCIHMRSGAPQTYEDEMAMLLDLGPKGPLGNGKRLRIPKPWIFPKESRLSQSSLWTLKSMVHCRSLENAPRKVGSIQEGESIAEQETQKALGPTELSLVLQPTGRDCTFTGLKPC